MTSTFQGHGDQAFGHITYSQCGEDLLICDLLYKVLKIEKPTYLDIGAHHPFNISNTALLYSRGAIGVNVEANPNLIGEFYKHRPNDENVQVAVVPDKNTKSVTLHMYDKWSGRNSCIAGYLESDPFGALPERDKIEVPALTINQIVSNFCQWGKFPNFLSVDIEGLDYDVLASADFENLGYPDVICVEALRYRQPERLVELMKSRGYEVLIRIAINLVFIKSETVHLFRG